MIYCDDTVVIPSKCFIAPSNYGYIYHKCQPSVIDCHQQRPLINQQSSTFFQDIMGYHS